MALVVCTECGHRISSLARFCPKCNHPGNNSAPSVPSPHAEQSAAPAVPPAPEEMRRTGIASCDELLQREFVPSADEAVILEGRTFLIKGILNVADCYAYLTTKRYVVCDAAGANILFQIGNNGFASVEDGRHVISKKIIITAASGDKYQIKCFQHYTWFGALLDPRGAFLALGKPKTAPPVENAGTLDWYYESEGVTVGPVHEKDIIQLIKSCNAVFRNTRVWNKSLPEWKPAEETILSIFFSDSLGSGGAKTGKSSGVLGRLLPSVQVFCRKYL